jgi:hypothetical protein
MVFRMVILSVLTWGFSAQAERMGFADGDDTPVVQVSQPRPAAPPISLVPPLPPPRPQVQPDQPPVSLADVQLITEVDKSSQTILITSPDIENPGQSRKDPANMQEFFKHCSRKDIRKGPTLGHALPKNQCMAKVSTGGGVHTTNPRNGTPRVVCTDDETPEISNRIIHSVTEGNIRKITAHNTYFSSTYDGAEMRWATRMQNNCDTVPHSDCAIFFHMYPPFPRQVQTQDGRTVTIDVNRRALGTNVSGGCIRMEEKVAWFVNQDLRERAKMSVTIGGDSPKHCTPEAMARAQAALERSGGQQQPGNGEGWTPPRNIFTDIFGGIFGGGRR